MGSFEIPDTFNLAAYLADRHVAEGRGSRVAIYYQDQKITYSQLVANVNRTGNALRTLGLEMENRLVMVLPDCPEFFYGFLGAMKIGAVPIAVNTLALPKDYAYFLNDSRAKVLIVHADFLPKIEEVNDELK
jgi:acyl-coenzyme A synthetase/AMP-(fatty) acid ligase